MPRTQPNKKSGECSASDSDADHSNSEGDKLAVRRARNREAARRVRERRVNAIKTLSEQVEQLVAENQELRDKLAAAEGSTAHEAKSASPAVSVTRAGVGQALQDADELQVATRSIATQTDAAEPAVKPESANTAAEQEQQLQQQPAGTNQQPAFHDQLQQHPLLSPSTSAAATATQNPALFNLQQLHILVQMQMQLLQLQNNAASPASSGGMQLPNQQPVQAAISNHIMQAARAVSQINAAAAAAADPVPADAWSAEGQRQQHPLPQNQAQQHRTREPGSWGYMPAADTAQSSSNAPAQRLQQQQQQQHHHQQQQQTPGMLPLPRLPPLQHRQQQLQQQQQQQHQLHQPASRQPSSQQQPRQQPGIKPAPAAVAAAAPSGPDAPGDEARFSTIPEDNVLCQLGEDDSILMSTDMNLSNSGLLNLNTGDLNMNTADLNITNSGFNAMMASEELLRHVPTPEEATASRSTAWL